MIEALSYEFMQRALIASVLIGICTGLISPYLVLRRLSLLGDGLAHLAFGGIAIAFLLNTPPILTALIVTMIGSLLVRRLIEKDVYGEAAIALILSFGVGIAIVIIGATRGFGVDLFSYLIGSILLLRWFDLGLLAILLVVLIGFVLYFQRELFLLTLSKDLAKHKGQNVKIADYLFSILVAIVTLMSIQAVGILLVTALLVIPGLISFKLAKSFTQSLFYAIAISIGSGVFGVISSYYLDLPPSGLIVLFLLALFTIISYFKR